MSQQAISSSGMSVLRQYAAIDKSILSEQTSVTPPNTWALIIHIVLNRTLFIRPTALWDLVLWAVHLLLSVCVCMRVHSMRKQVWEWKKKNILNLLMHEAANFVISN